MVNKCSGPCALWDVRQSRLCAACEAESDRKDKVEGIVIIGKTRVLQPEEE